MENTPNPNLLPFDKLYDALASKAIDRFGVAVPRDFATALPMVWNKTDHANGMIFDRVRGILTRVRTTPAFITIAGIDTVVAPLLDERETLSVFHYLSSIADTLPLSEKVTGWNSLGDLIKQVADRLPESWFEERVTVEASRDVIVVCACCNYENTVSFPLSGKANTNR